jgi:hypothetical protein
MGKHLNLCNYSQSYFKIWNDEFCTVKNRIHLYNIDSSDLTCLYVVGVTDILHSPWSRSFIQKRTVTKVLRNPVPFMKPLSSMFTRIPMDPILNQTNPVHTNSLIFIPFYPLIYAKVSHGCLFMFSD